MLEVEVCEVRGRCVVHRVGDRFIVDGPNLILERGRAVCVHALAPLLHYVVALDHGVSPLELGLTKRGDEGHAYIQCVDPGRPYTDGGTVVFRVRRVSE